MHMYNDTPLTLTASSVINYVNYILQDLLDTVGVHPTIAEQFTMLEVSKSSGKSMEKASC